MRSPIYSLKRSPFKKSLARKACSAVLLLPFLFITSNTQAQASEAIWEIGASYQFFDYEETSSTGTTLNTETGWLPGIYISATTPLLKDFYLTATASRAKGSVDYEGTTQAGRPLSTATVETLTHIRAELTIPLSNISPDSLSGIAGLGYTRWNRNIQATAQSKPLVEHYHWYELFAGAQHCSSPQVAPGIKQVCIAAKLIRTKRGTMTIQLEDLNLGRPELNLGNGWGGEGRIKLFLIEPFTLTLYARTWNHGASEPVNIQKGNRYIRITEPASQSWLTGIEAGLRF